MAEATLDVAEQVARVLRSQEETHKFVSEQRKLMAEETKLNAEAAKLIREEMKLGAETAKLQRDRELSLWQVMIAGMASGAALFGAGAAFIKLISA